jgi:hypothetical protein
MPDRLNTERNSRQGRQARQEFPFYLMTIFLLPFSMLSGSVFLCLSDFLGALGGLGG